MRLRLLLLLALVLPTACGDDTGSPGDMSAAVDYGAFIPCDISKGQMTNPGCPANMPICHPAAQVCVGCIPSFQTCLPGYECNEQFQCVVLDPNKPCKRNVDCPKRLDGFDAKAIVCQVDSGQCVECLANTDCVAPDVCVQRLKKCGDPCLECTGDQICDRVNGVCLNPDGGI